MLVTCAARALCVPQVVDMINAEASAKASSLIHLKL